MGRRRLARQARVLLEPLRLQLCRFYHTQPDFIIVGAQKAGTSALHNMLMQHEYISSSRIKEVHYFDNDEWFGAKRSEHKYHSYFPLPCKVSRQSLQFESTPAYLYHPKTASRIFSYSPNIKIICFVARASQ